MSKKKKKTAPKLMLLTCICNLFKKGNSEFLAIQKLTRSDNFSD